MHENPWLVSQVRDGSVGVWHQLSMSGDLMHGSSQEFWGICFLYPFFFFTCHWGQGENQNLGVTGKRDTEALLEGKKSSWITCLGNYLGGEPDTILKTEP